MSPGVKIFARSAGSKGLAAHAPNGDDQKWYTINYNATHYLVATPAALLQRERRQKEGKKKKAKRTAK